MQNGNIFNSIQVAVQSPSTVSDECQQYTHHKLKFLKDGFRKDKYGRLHTDPDYDGRTLHVS